MLKQSVFLTCLIVSSLSLLFIIGCSISTTSTKKHTDYELDAFVGGITGLDINVLDGAPPSVIQDSGLTPFSFIISVENVGEADVGPGTDNPLVFARLAGIMHRNFGLEEDEIVKTLDSKLSSAKRNFDGSIFPGEINYIGFDNLAYEPNLFESLVLTIRAEVCYDYETVATTKICIKKDVLESWEDASICTLRGPKPVGNSGAPIQVTSVEEAPVNSNTVQINFVIEHVGNGVFFYRDDASQKTKSTDLLDACAFDDLNQDIYKLEVLVEPVQENIYDIDCMRLDNELEGGGASGTVKMFRGAPVTVSCFLKRVKPMQNRIYQDLLNIRLRYRYGDFIEVPILIQGHP